MSILIYQASFNGVCDTSNDKVLSLLGFVPETAGKMIDGEIHRFMINELPEGIDSACVYLINDKNITVPGIYVIFERIFERGDKDYEKAQAYRQHAAGMFLSEILSQVKNETPGYRDSEAFGPEIDHFHDGKGTLGYHVMADNSAIREKLADALRNQLGVASAEIGNEATDNCAPDKEKFFKVYSLAASCQVDVTIEYHDDPRDFSIAIHSPCEEERFSVHNTSFDIAADMVIEHLEILLAREKKE